MPTISHTLSPDSTRHAKAIIVFLEMRRFIKEHFVGLSSWIAVVLLGLVQCFAGRFTVGVDGVSYLDLADAFSRGEWHNAINAYWSPLYPFVISLVLRIVRPSGYYEAPTIHALNYILYLACFASLQFFVREIWAWLSNRSEKSGITETSLDGLATLLFLLMTQHYIRVADVTPDMLVAICCFVASGLVLRIRRLGTTPARLMGLGLVLGLGYLAKAIMFPVSFVFLAVALLEENGLKRAFLNVTAGLLGFFLIAGPNIYALSKREHRLTFGEAGKLNYIFYVNGGAHLPFDPSGDPQGAPFHPARKIFSSPNAYEFAGPVGGSYPVWYDPVYWRDGLLPRVDWHDQLAAIKRNLSPAKLFFHEGGLLAMWALLMVVQYRSGFFSWRRTLGLWRVLLPALTFFVLYALVYLEARYVGAAVVTMGIANFASVRLDHARWPRIFAVVLAVVAANVALVLIPHLLVQVRQTMGKPRNLDWEVAQGLQRDFGLREGDRVGCVDCLNLGGEGTFGAYWARLAKVRIIAEIPPTQKDVFLSSSPAVQTAVLRAMLVAGAKVIVVRRRLGAEWRQIGATGYFVYAPGAATSHIP